MEDLLVESGEDPTKVPQNSVIEKQSSAESVKRTLKTIKLNATVTPKVSGSTGPTRKRMEVKNISDSGTTGVKSAATKYRSSRNSTLAPVTRRNNTRGLPEKQPLNC